MLYLLVSILNIAEHIYTLYKEIFRWQLNWIVLENFTDVMFVNFARLQYNTMKINKLINAVLRIFDI